MRIPFISLIAASSIALGGCAYGSFGMGYGDPYSSYGYGSPYGYAGSYGGYGTGYGYGSSYGYGSPYGYSGYGYGSPYYGWNNGYYYPGTGYYVYDSYRRPVRWSDSQQRYWTERRNLATRSGVKVVEAPNWNGFTRPRTVVRDQSVGNRAATRQQIERAQARAEQAKSKVETRRAERVARRAASDDDDSRTERRRRPN